MQVSHAQALDSPDSRKTHARAQFCFCLAAAMDKVSLVAYSCALILRYSFQYIPVYRCHLYIHNCSFQHVRTSCFLPVVPIPRFQVLSENGQTWSIHVCFDVREWRSNAGHNGHWPCLNILTVPTSTTRSMALMVVSKQRAAARCRKEPSSVVRRGP